MKKYDFSKLTIKGIDGKEIKTEEKLHVSVWNIVFNNTMNLELSELAKKIHKWEEVELRTGEVEQIRQIFSNEKLQLSPIFSREVINFLKD